MTGSLRFTGRSRGTIPVPFTVGRGPVPRRASVYRTLAGDRPPRYGIVRVSWHQNGRLHRRARACPSPCFCLPADRGVLHRDREVSPTGRAWVCRSVAGDRPPRYVVVRVSWHQNGRLHRRARACPSPCLGLPNVRGGQAPALRYCEGFLAGERPPSSVGRGPVPRRARCPDYVYTLASVNP